jgi:hypothetical protein
MRNGQWQDLDRRLKEPDFELTKPSTGQECYTRRSLLGYQLTMETQTEKNKHPNKNTEKAYNKQNARKRKAH